MDESDGTVVEFVVVDFAELRSGPLSNGVGWRSEDGKVHSEFNEVITERFHLRVLRAIDPDEHAAGTVIARITFHDPDNPADSTFEWEAPFRPRRPE